MARYYFELLRWLVRMNGAVAIWRGLTCLGVPTTPSSPSSSSGGTDISASSGDSASSASSRDSGPLGPSHPHPSCPPLIQVDGNILPVKKAITRISHQFEYNIVSKQPAASPPARWYSLPCR